MTPDNQTEKQNNTVEIAEGPARPRVEELSLREALAILFREKRTIAKCAVAATLLSAIVSLLIPKQFTAEAVIFTPRQAQSSLSAMVQLSGVGAGTGLDLLSSLGFRNTADLYIGVLQSRSIADSIISRFSLKRVYEVNDFYAARKRLARNTSIKSGKDTLIHIRVDDRDAKRSADLANAYVEELARQSSESATGEAAQRRIFFERQLFNEKEMLADAEIALKNTEQTTGLVAPSGQAEALLRSAAQLRAEILSRQAQIDGLRTFVSDDNPKFQRVKRELSTLQQEMAQLERGSHTAGSPEVPANLLPQAGLEYIRRYRDVKYHETLYEILAKQYEAARLDEARVGSPVQIVDRALTPERKSWPPKVLLTLGGGFFAAAASGFYFLAKHAWQNPPLRL